MMALQRRNPDAFRRGNVNLLRQGVVLEIPQPGEIAQLSPGEARRAFLQQTREWRALRSGTQRAVAPSPRPSPAAASPAQPRQRVLTEVVEDIPEKDGASSAKLRVVAPEGDWQVDGDVAARDSYPAGEEEKLREAIADSESDLAAVREINRDLVELREALETKIAALRKTLEERDRTIETLMHRLNRGDESVSDAGRSSAEAQAPSAPAAVASVGSQDQVRAPIQVAALVPQPGERTDITRWAQTYRLPLLVTAGFLLLLLTATMLRRRRDAAVVPEPDAFDSFLNVDEEPQIAAPRPTQPVRLAGAENFKSFAQPQDPVAEKAMDISSALTEADVYLAYRRYTQAETLLQNAIRQNPKSMILCAKLLEIYAFRKDKQSFTAFMEEMPLVTDWRTITKMPNVVAVPFFISDGLHSYQDIPVLLGIETDQGEAASRREIFRRNPYHIDGRSLFYASAIGTEPLFADVIIEQVASFDKRHSRELVPA